MKNMFHSFFDGMADVVSSFFVAVLFLLFN